MSQIKIRFDLFMENFSITILIAMVSFVPHAQARVVAEEFIENGKKIVVLQNIRDDDGVVEGMAISGPNGLEVRVDSDGDGEADWRKIESGDYEIEQSWPANGIFRRMKVVRKLPKERVEALFFLARDRKGYELWKIEKRPYEVMFASSPFGNVSKPKAKQDFGSLTPASASFGQLPQASQAVPKGAEGKSKLESDQFCSLREIPDPFSSTWKDLARKIEVESLMQSPSARATIDKSCEKYEKAILEGVAEVLFPENRQGARYFACMRKLDSLSRNANLGVLKLWNSIRRSESGALFQCKGDLGIDKLARFEEKGRPPFTLNPVLFNDLNKGNVAKAIFHEIVHASGVHDEKQVRNIVSCCSARFDGQSSACAESASAASTVLDPRLLENGDLSRIIASLESKGEEHQQQAAQEMIRIIDAEVQAAGCNRSGVASESCREPISKAIQMAYSRIVAKFCSDVSEFDICRDMKRARPGDFTKLVDSCMSAAAWNICDRQRAYGFGSDGAEIPIHPDVPDQTKKDMAYVKAAPVRRLSPGSPAEVPSMHYQPIQGDDVQQMRVAATQSQGLVPRAVARIKNSFEKIDTRFIPRAQAETNSERFVSKVEMPTYASLGMRDARLGVAGHFRLNHDFSLVGSDIESNSRQRSIASAGISGGTTSSLNSDSLPASGTSSADIASEKVGRSAEGSSLGKGRGARSSSGGIGGTISAGTSGRSSAEEQRSLYSTYDGSEKALAIESESDARAVLSRESNPEILAGTPWFESRLRELKIQIVGGQRIYGILPPAVPEKRWNIKIFKKVDLP